MRLITKLERKLRKVLNNIRFKNSIDIRELKKLRGKYAGKRAFLIGNGPSLNATPMHLLQDEYSIGFNRINVLFERTNWRPSFYALTDFWIAKDMWKELEHIHTEVDYAFYPIIDPVSGSAFKGRMYSGDNVKFLPVTNRGFCKELTNPGINGTVAILGMQILAYLGFSEIYLVGVDMSYFVPETTTKISDQNFRANKNDDPNHFDPRYFGAGRNFSKPRINDLVLPNYYLAKDFLNEQRIDVYNATVGGKLEVWPRKDVFSLFDVTIKEELYLLAKGFVDDPTSFYSSIPQLKNIEDLESLTSVSFKTKELPMALKLISKLIESHHALGPLNRQEYLFVKK